MTRRKFLRRVAILCRHCLRNLAYYKAGFPSGERIFEGQFLTTANGNFLDICVLEWCKLFGDPRGKHYWGKVVKDRAAFHEGLLKKCAVSEEQFKESIEEMRTYRDTFVAHLDLEARMQIPKLKIVEASVCYLYDYLLRHENEGWLFSDAPAKASMYYTENAKEGSKGYER